MQMILICFPSSTWKLRAATFLLTPSQSWPQQVSNRRAALNTIPGVFPNSDNYYTLLQDHGLIQKKESTDPNVGLLK